MLTPAIVIFPFPSCQVPRGTCFSLAAPPPFFGWGWVVEAIAGVCNGILSSQTYRAGGGGGCGESGVVSLLISHLTLECGLGLNPVFHR